GIRDFHVTGVQTCALPIWTAGGISSRGCRAAPCSPSATGTASPATAAWSGSTPNPARSSWRSTPGRPGTPTSTSVPNCWNWPAPCPETAPMRLSLHTLPIKTKLVLIILLTSTLSLALAAGSFIAYERVRVKDELVKNLTSLARVIADRSTAALLFDDAEVARETLNALKVKRAIV